MSRSSVLQLFGALLCAGALLTWFSDGFSLPSKSPPTRYYFRGLSLTLLGLAQLVLGAATVWLARRPEQRHEPAAKVVLVAPFALLAGAVLQADQV